jgi:hypothetical protein
MRTITNKTLDTLVIERTVGELTAIIKDFTNVNRKFTGDNHCNREKFEDAAFELCVLRRQTIRIKNRHNKAPGIAYSAPAVEYFYIPKAVNYTSANKF